MDGLFLENGPFKIDSGNKLKTNPNSWHKVSKIISLTTMTIVTNTISTYYCCCYYYYYYCYYCYLLLFLLLLLPLFTIRDSDLHWVACRGI